MNMAILGALALLIYLAVLARTTYLLWATDYLERDQKIAQTALIWVVPIAGVYLVRGMMAMQGSGYGPSRDLSGYAGIGSYSTGSEAVFGGGDGNHGGGFDCGGGGGGFDGGCGGHSG